MKTRTQAATVTPGLPPPPAPPSRDANPWPLAQKPEAAKAGVSTAKVATSVAAPRERAVPAAVRRRSRVAPGAGGVAASHRPRRHWLPTMILLLVAGTALRVGLAALESGDVESALGALALVAMVAFIAWRQMTSGR